MKVIVFANGDGGVGVVCPVQGSGLSIEEIAQKDVPQGAAYKIVEITKELDRTFRQAWRFHEQDGVHVDMTHAREIHKDNMRRAREPKMIALDIEQARAFEDDDAAKKAAVKSKKQALRDITKDPRIEAAQTPEQLKAVWPEVLK